MKKRSRFLFLHKLAVANFLLAIVFLFFRPDFFSFIRPDKEFHFYLGAALVLGMFLEIGGIISKTKFIYGRHENRERKIPLILSLSFVPRMLLASGVVILAFIGMGFFELSDFILLPIVIYAVVKEFWVRGTLLNSETVVAKRISGNSAITGEVFLFLFVVIAYACLWELVLLDNLIFQKIISDPAYFPLIGAVFLVLLLTVQMPNLLEEFFRKKKPEHVMISMLSFLLPVSTFLINVARIGLKWKT